MSKAFQSKNRAKFIDYSYFRDVARNQVELTPEQEIKLFERYGTLYTKLKKAMLSNGIIRANLFEVIGGLKDSKKSIAKLHCKFDNRKYGHNKGIIKEINRKLGEIKPEDTAETVAKKLYDIGFSKEVYSTIYNMSVDSFSPELKERFETLKEEIKQIESALSHSVLKMAIAVAHKYASNIFNMDIKDAIQEANLGIFDAISLYNPAYRTSKGKRVKFLTYANIWAEKRVKEKIMESSRLIKLPKSKLNTLFTVLRVCATLEDPSIDIITEETNKVIEKKKKRKLKPTELLTEEKVLEAIALLNNNCIMLDSPIDGYNDTPGEIKTFSDVIPDIQLTSEDTMIVKDSRLELVELIRKSVSFVEERIIHIRYINDPPKSHDETAELLFQEGITKKRLSKQAIKQKESIALQKLAQKDTKGVLKELLLANITIKNKLEN